MPKLKLKTLASKAHTSTNLTPDTQQMLEFKRFFHGKTPACYSALAEAPNLRDRRPVQLRGPLTTHAVALAQANGRGHGVFMVVNRGGTRDRDIQEITAVFIDSDGQMSLEQILALKPHLVVQTSSGRYHAYWRVTDLPVQEFKRFQQALAAKFGTDPSVCNPARLMRMPGTVHRKDRPRLVKIEHIRSDAKPVSAPKLAKRLGLDLQAQKVAASVELSGDTSLSVARSALQVIPADDRCVWLKVGLAIHDLMPDDEGYGVWTEWSQRSGKYEADDQRRTWDGFVKGGGTTVASLFWLAGQHGWKPSATDGGDVDELTFLDRFGEHVKEQLRYEATSAKWLLFRAPVWVKEEAAVVQAARRAVESLRADAKKQGDAATLAVLKPYRTVPALRGLLNAASALPALVVNRDALDCQPNLLAVANGVIDLTTGLLSAGRPDQLLTLKAPTAHDPEATCRRFLKFLRFVTKGDEEYMAYLQRALGYTLFGHTNEQVFFVVFGKSGNGKGTLFRTLAHVLGPYVMPVAPSLLSRAYSGNPNAPSPALMALKDPRMIQCSEGGDRQQFDSAFVKGLSGSDPLTGRGTYSDQAQFTPQGKLWLSANSLPEVPSQDDAMWRRIRVLPFSAKIKNRDGAFEDLLKAEASGILNWLIQGAVNYHQHRLGECQVVKQATARARRSSDSVAAWIKEMCRIDPDGRIQSRVAYESYRKHCRLNGWRELSPQAFARAMNAKSHRTKETKRHNVFVGLELRGE